MLYDKIDQLYDALKKTVQSARAERIFAVRCLLPERRAIRTVCSFTKL